MRLLDFGSLAARHVRNGLAEEVYLHTGQDFTRPVTIYGTVNEVCNYKCGYCECWRRAEYEQELTIDEWQNAILSLKEFLGQFHIQFSGGEPYIKKGFVDLLRFCHEQGVSWGVITNGSAYLSDNIVKQTVAAQPLNINISIDSKRPEVHDRSRGIDGSLERVVKGIRKIADARAAAGQSFPIVIKPVVHRLNFRYLTEMVEWVQEIGATVISFQPVDRWTPETYGDLWITEQKDMDELARVRDELVAMKRAGAPILNSELILGAWEKHFREEKAPPEYMPCRVGMRNFFIRPNGDVELCWFYKRVGNVKTMTAREIWYGEEARGRRKETVECDSLCLFTCLSHKTLGDKVKMGLTLISGLNKDPWQPAGQKAG
jgi:MoaA/NifB/PqqE/SkfB family radical SAM enzyme